VLAFAAGLYMLVAPLDGAFTLTVILVIWFFASGSARLAVGFSEHGAPGAGLMVFSGLLAIGLGLLIALDLPSSADWAVGLIVGIDLIFGGVSLLALASRLRLLVP
jgi:uncharacterized membrane protein HdeD (DUF308 family)